MGVSSVFFYRQLSEKRGRMKRPYSLDNKIDALNQIERHDGNIASVSDVLEIPEGTLKNWKQREKDFRRQYRKRQERQRDPLVEDLRLQMLQRGQVILARMDDETIAKAPLNQLASALSALVSHALKLEEAINEIDEQEERVVRFEHYYNGSVHLAPPWAGASEGFDRTLQDRGVWEALGQDRAGQDHPAASSNGAEAALLVDGADKHDGEPGLARLESERFAS